MFLQLHTLTSHHATLLNRDDAGLAKRIPFGNAQRLRVSSQCLKRHWRLALAQRFAASLPDAVRSRHFFSRVILPRLQEEGAMEQARAVALTDQLKKGLIKSSGAKEEKAAKGGKGAVDPVTQLAMAQPVLFGAPEADYLVSLALEAHRQHAATEAACQALAGVVGKAGDNFKAMLKSAGFGNQPGGLSAALFGRMVTSDILARVDAAVHVAHAFTVHRADTEVDYFTVVDDLNTGEETGAAHAGDMELGAGLYYGYVVVDLPLLVSNLSGVAPEKWREGDLGTTRAVLGALVEAAATVSPGAKKGSTAPYAWADWVLLEGDAGQPRSLANAYLEALPQRGDAMTAAAQRAVDHLHSLDAMYGAGEGCRAVASRTGVAPAGVTPEALPKAVARVLDHLLGEG